MVDIERYLCNDTNESGEYTLRFEYYADDHYLGMGETKVYFDDNNGGNSVYGNVMQRCQSAIHLHGGQDMVVKNNLILDAPPSSHRSIFWTYCRFTDFFVPGGNHERGVKEYYCESRIWQEKYPRLGEYITRDPKEQGYPHYCDFSDNIIINHAPIVTN